MVEQAHLSVQLARNAREHGLRKRTWVADRRALPDTRGQRNGVRAPLDQLPRAQHRPLAGAAAAAHKPDDLDVLLHAGKYARPLPNRAKIGRSGTDFLGLHASNDAQFHDNTSLKNTGCPARRRGRALLQS